MVGLLEKCGVGDVPGNVMKNFWNSIEGKNITSLPKIFKGRSGENEEVEKYIEYRTQVRYNICRCY